METTKTPWRKNLDKRYISGEDLLNGEAMNKGLRPEMVVTLAKFGDVKAFDQGKQEEVNKTALWLKEWPSGKLLYKPAILNVKAADFLSKEIAGGSLNIDDSDLTIPFVIYAQPDKRFGHVARFKKYYAPSTVSDIEPLRLLSQCDTLAGLSDVWKALSDAAKKLPTVLAKKEALKAELK